ncbi:Uncharacterized protein QJS10_CPB13g00344 [Acorus calamus]|uniref:MORF/ORRM1/DAG-like MORF domain-containing protein n=1 Tax=Acorus calamus TaxID=4465 RepID=A0AAV9DHT8_ACOCL|nr:Uncharacterized protein QJS10_CPB13g00344 [Acorus calamus]
MKIYSVSTKHYFAFGALVSEELSYKIKELPKVRWVLPDSYLDVKNKDYGGEPFINGQAVPYDPKYHEEWVRNNARANERSRRNDRPRNFDRSRNFERRRENMQNQYRDGPPMQNQGFQNHPDAGGPHPPNQGFQNQPNTGFAPPPNQGFQNQPNMGFTSPQNNRFQGQSNTGFAPPHNQDQGLPDMGNMGNMSPPNQGFQHYPNRDVHPPNADFTNRGLQNRGMPNRDYQNSNYRPNQELEGMHGNSHQTRDMHGRDAPPMPNQN